RVSRSSQRPLRTRRARSPGSMRALRKRPPWLRARRRTGIFSMHLKSAELLESHSRRAHSPCRKVNTDDDLLIDDKGLPVAPSEGAKQHLAASAGAWKLLSTPSELLLALRDHGDGLLPNLSMLHPAGAVLAGDMSEMQPSDLLNFLHQGRRT